MRVYLKSPEEVKGEEYPFDEAKILRIIKYESTHNYSESRDDAGIQLEEVNDDEEERRFDEKNIIEIKEIEPARNHSESCSDNVNLSNSSKCKTHEAANVASIEGKIKNSKLKEESTETATKPVVNNKKESKNEVYYVYDTTNWNDFVPYNITHLTIKSNVPYIKDAAFQDRLHLRTVVFEENSSCTTIGKKAFRECWELRHLQFPSTTSVLTTIDDYAFDSCRKLQTSNNNKNKNNIMFVLPSSVCRIGSCAFFDARSIVSIEIPPLITNVGTHTFQYCRGLQTVKFHNDSQLQQIDKEAFYACPSLREILNFPYSSNTSIDENAFFSCDKLSFKHQLNEDNHDNADMQQDTIDRDLVEKSVQNMETERGNEESECKKKNRKKKIKKREKVSERAIPKVIDATLKIPSKPKMRLEVPAGLSAGLMEEEPKENIVRKRIIQKVDDAPLKLPSKPRMRLEVLADLSASLMEEEEAGSIQQKVEG